MNKLLPKSRRPTPLRPWSSTKRLVTRAAFGILIPIAAISLSACQSAPTIMTDAGCVTFPRLTFDRLKDTAETIEQVKAYDARRDAICGKGE